LSSAVYGKGDTLKFRISPKPSNIRKIKWFFSDGTTSTRSKPLHIFTVKGSAIPGEGFAKIKAIVTLYNKTKIQMKTRIFISPNLNCQIDVEALEPITDLTTYVELNASPLCEMIVLGSPINGNSSYACGGACEAMCPIGEVVCHPIKVSGKSDQRLTHYGIYELSSQCGVRCPEDGNLTCIDLYKKNHIGKYSKYYPTKMSFQLCPNLMTLSIIPSTSVPNVLTTFKISNLAEALLPSGTKIEWIFTNPTDLTIKYLTNSSFVEHTITDNATPTDVTVMILIPGCDIITLLNTINT
jgi:hypothetical protein